MRVMIMAAGKGTRLRPLTDLMPKPMVPIVNRPALSHILHLLKRHGFREVIMNLHHMPEAITDCFGDGSAVDMALSYSFEPELLGTADPECRLPGLLSAGCLSGPEMAGGVLRPGAGP